MCCGQVKPSLTLLLGPSVDPHCALTVASVTSTRRWQEARLPWSILIITSCHTVCWVTFSVCTHFEQPTHFAFNVAERQLVCFRHTKARSSQRQLASGYSQPWPNTRSIHEPGQLITRWWYYWSLPVRVYKHCRSLLELHFLQTIFIAHKINLGYIRISQNYAQS